MAAGWIQIADPGSPNRPYLNMFFSLVHYYHSMPASQANMVLNVHKNHKAYLRWGEGGMEVGGGEGDYIPITTLSPPEWLPH